MKKNEKVCGRYEFAVAAKLFADRLAAAEEEARNNNRAVISRFDAMESALQDAFDAFDEEVGEVTVTSHGHKVVIVLFDESDGSVSYDVDVDGNVVTLTELTVRNNLVKYFLSR